MTPATRARSKPAARAPAFVWIGLRAWSGRLRATIDHGRALAVSTNPAYGDEARTPLETYCSDMDTEPSRSPFYEAAAALGASFMQEGGWWWTEVMYDLQVIHSLPELKHPTAPAEIMTPPQAPPTNLPPALKSPTAVTGSMPDSRKTATPQSAR